MSESQFSLMYIEESKNKRKQQQNQIKALQILPFRFRACGMVNMGATCPFNSLFHLYFHDNFIVDWFGGKDLFQYREHIEAQIANNNAEQRPIISSNEMEIDRQSQDENEDDNVEMVTEYGLYRVMDPAELYAHTESYIDHTIFQGLCVLFKIEYNIFILNRITCMRLLSDSVINKCTSIYRCT